MPRPLFIICSEHMSIDRDSEFVSLFRLVEAVTFQPDEEQKLLEDTDLPLKIISAWMREEADDFETDFEFRLGRRLPTSGRFVVMKTEEFRFKKSFHRFIANTIFPGYDGEGIMWFVGQVRKKGEAEWISHEYPVIMKASEPEEIETGDEVEIDEKDS